MTERKVEAWGAAYKERTRGRETGDECIVCGRHTSGKATFAAASPATGGFVDASIIGTERGDAIEASLYPIGSECAKAVRAAFPSAIATGGTK